MPSLAPKRRTLTGFGNTFPHTGLGSLREAVDLPKGQMGSSEAAPLNSVWIIQASGTGKTNKSIEDNLLEKIRPLFLALKSDRNTPSTFAHQGPVSPGSPPTDHLLRANQFGDKAGSAESFCPRLPGRGATRRPKAPKNTQASRKTSKIWYVCVASCFLAEITP